MGETLEELRVELSDHDEVVAGVYSHGERVEVFEKCRGQP